MTAKTLRARATRASLDTECNPERVDVGVMLDKPRFRSKDALRERVTLAGAAFVLKARKQAGLTQEELAAALGITQTRVAQLESGPSRRGRPPELLTLARIAQVCGRELVLELQ